MKQTPTTLFVCGDLMTGRGIDQILGHPGDPQLHEPWARSAAAYVELAERGAGPIPRRVDPAYIWGDALARLDSSDAQLRIVNLETAITARGEPWPGKAIHYRMHPANIDCLSVAGIDCCVLANNHVLDWGPQGLSDTLDLLRGAGIAWAGAGRNQARATAPAVLGLPGATRVLVFSCATDDSGVDPGWAAGPARAGVHRLDALGPEQADAIIAQAGNLACAGDLVVVSIHWGGNWGFEVDPRQRAFAHRLIDSGAVHLVHGHSSHHPRPIEIRGDGLILYGCGDLLNDYEGIEGHRQFRPELSLMYFPAFDPVTRRLLGLKMAPMRIRRFRLEHAEPDDARWLADTLARECRPFGASVLLDGDGELSLAAGS